MPELSIKVTIANRIYPLKVKFEEEENIRKATQQINEKIKEYENSYSVRDKQDVLAMSALHFATELLNEDGQKAMRALNDAEQKVTELDELITENLKSEI